MTQTEFIGLAVLTIITLGSFVGVVLKFVQPINDLRVVIQQLKDCIDNLKDNDETRDKRLDEHDKEISGIKTKVGKIETKMALYHKEN